MGTLAGDFNEDGLIDLMVYFWGRTPVIYLRKPDGLPASGVPPSSGSSQKQLSAGAFAAHELIDSGERWYSDCATQADLDGDGHVDLLIANYFQDGARILDARATGTEVMHQGKARSE